jgi:PHD/YefM family antitoxin component YafN of YafNO toxin-antitoxin module
MKIIGLTEAKDKLSSVIEKAKNNPTIITKNGKTAAILIVPEDDLDLERLLLLRSQMLQDVLHERQEEIRRSETISLRRRLLKLTQDSALSPNTRLNSSTAVYVVEQKQNQYCQAIDCAEQPTEIQAE